MQVMTAFLASVHCTVSTTLSVHQQYKYRFNQNKGARIFDLTVTSIDINGPQQLATEELAIHHIQHF